MDQSKTQDQEIDIYPLALAKFLQAAPELGDSILSYKDISQDLPQSEDIKVGIFILRAGTEVFYVPVVSKSENIYPIDSVFQVSKGLFYPLTRKMIEIVLTSGKGTQGKPAKIPRGVSSNPDMTTLITPPRTGKFAYASSSRLGDFLASMPNHLKQFTMTKIAEEKSAYEELHKLFPIQEIFAALQPAPEGMPLVTNAVPVSVVTGASKGYDLTGEEVAQILKDGYAVRGEALNKRLAVTQLGDDCKFSEITNLDGNSDFELSLKNGQKREAFIPSIVDLGVHSGTNSVAIFTDGSYASSRSFIAAGTRMDRKNVLTTLFEHNPPVLPRDVSNDEEFAVIDSDAKLIGVFRAGRVFVMNDGVELRVSVIAGCPTKVQNIIASHNYGAYPSIVGNTLYLPYSSLVILLPNGNRTLDLEANINAASKHSELAMASLLGDQLNIGYDEVEFTVNNRPIGVESDLMNLLAVKESIDPSIAANFIKQAKEKKFLRVYLSKKASNDFQPGEIPQYGNQPKPQGKVGLNGSFMPKVQASLKLGDAQATESTIISELLQCPDMFELIQQYQPDLEQCIDRLGRILFLSRVNINQLAEGNDIDSVFSFLAGLKNTYKNLGDNFIKLNELIALKPNASK